MDERAHLKIERLVRVLSCESGKGIVDWDPDPRRRMRGQWDPREREKNINFHICRRNLVLLRRWVACAMPCICFHFLPFDRIFI